MRYDIADINKVATILNAIKNTELNVDEFTKKDFDKIFKGTKICPADFSLDWLRENGVDDSGKVCSNNSWVRRRKTVTPFVSIVREEKFVVPNKTTHERGYALADENGNILDGYNADDFGYPKMRALIEEKFGKVHLVEIKKPLMGTRYYYKINFDALSNVGMRNNDIAKYYEDKILKMSNKLAKYQKALDIISARA